MKAKKNKAARVDRGAREARGMGSSSGKGAAAMPAPSAPASPSAPPALRWEGLANPEQPVRADKYLADELGLMTRSQLKARAARLFRNGREVKFSCKLTRGDALRLEWTEAPSEEFVAEELPLDLIYRDDDVYVIDKPQGMVTHPAAGNWSGTLANGVLWLETLGASSALQEGDLRTPPPRAGIVHRLDKDTSGVIIVARTARAHEFLSRQFRDRAAHKEYFAIVRGAPKAERGRIDTWLARSPRDRKKFAVSHEGRGKHALTLYRVRRVWRIDARAGRESGAPSVYSLLALYPRTGRTHQLRVHCAHIGCPILGDPLYSKQDPHFLDATLMLHAHRLSISLPSKPTEATIFVAPIPQRFRHIAALLRLRSIPD